MAGNLEEGLRNDADMTRHATLAIPNSWSKTWQDEWAGEAKSIHEGALQIDLPQAASALFRSSGK
jgi:hypothetical protein